MWNDKLGRLGWSHGRECGIDIVNVVDLSFALSIELKLDTRWTKYYDCNGV